MKLKMLKVAGLFAVAVTMLSSQAQAGGCLEPYEKVSGISGSLSSVGSDTMLNLATYWGEGFAKIYPGVTVQIEAKGSSTAPPALIAGVSQLGPMSRKMKDKEQDEFEAKFGFKPTRFSTALDALAVFVNKDNPIEGLTAEQLDAIFGKSRKRKYAMDLNRWGQLGIGGDFKAKSINLYGRNSASGTYGYFKEHILKKGDFKDSVKEQPGSASVVQGVTEDRYAIGYSGIGYKTSGVRTVPLAEKAGKPYYDATPENAYSGKYLLARYLNLYIVKDPKKGADPVVREFIKYIFSKEGQAIVEKDGYMPVTKDVCEGELKKLL